jgi:hypothetical protein
MNFLTYGESEHGMISPQRCGKCSQDLGFKYLQEVTR